MLVLTKDNKTIKRLTQIMLLVDWIQQLAFGLGSSSVDWNAEPMQVTFRTFQLPVHELGVVLYIIFFVLVIIAIFLMVGFSFYVGDSLHRTGHYKSYMGALRVLRQFASLSMTILYIPTLRSLLVPLHPRKVDGIWVINELPTIHFFAPAHTALFIASVLTLLIFLPFIFTLVLLYYDSNELSSNPLARTNSRLEFFYVSMKCVLTVSFAFLQDYPHAVQAIGFTVFTTLTIVHVLFPPFYKWRPNQFRAGIYASAACACFMALIAIDMAEDRRYFVLIALPFTLAVAFQCGWVLSRHMLHRFTLRRRVREWEIAMEAAGMSEEEHSAAYHQKIRSLVESDFKFMSPAHVEIAARFLPRYPTQFQLDVAEEVYLAGIRKFQHSAQVLLQYSMFLFHRLSRPQAAEQSLVLSKQRPMIIDTEFSLFYKEREHKELVDAQELGADNMDVLSYVEFRKYFHVAEQSHRDAKLNIRRFLDAVTERANGKVLSQLATTIALHESKAKESYDLLLGRFPQSQTLLRQYASYLDEVEGKPQMAAQFYNLAAELVVETVPLFANCTKDFTAELVKCLRASTVARDDLIVRQGDMGNEMYIISRGTVEVTNADGSVVFAELHTGSFFGERALLVNQVRNANVRAVTHCDLLILDKRDFNKILRRFPSNRKFFQEIADHREQKRQAAVQNVGHSSARSGRTGISTTIMSSEGSQTNLASERDHADEIELSLEQHHSYVRKHLVAKKLAQIRAMNKKEETSSSVASLRRRFLAWCVVFTVMFVAIFPISERHLAYYCNDMTMQRDANTRDYTFQGLITHTRETAYKAEIASPFTSNFTDFVIKRNDIASDAAEFEELHKSLWTQKHQSLEVREAMGHKLYRAQPFIPGLDEGEETFWDIGLAIGRYGRELGRIPTPYEYQLNNFTVTAFASNGLGSIRTALYDNREAQYEQVWVNSRFWIYTLGIVFACSLAVELLFFLVAIVPLLRSVRHQEALSLRLFHTIPVSVVNQLKPRFMESEHRNTGGNSSPRDQSSVLDTTHQSTSAARRRHHAKEKVTLLGRWVRSVAAVVIAMGIVVSLCVFLVNGQSPHRDELRLAGSRVVNVHRLLFLSAEWANQEDKIVNSFDLNAEIQAAFFDLNRVNSDLQIGRSVPKVKRPSRQWTLLHGDPGCADTNPYCRGLETEIAAFRDMLSQNLLSMPTTPSFREARWAEFNKIIKHVNDGLVPLAEDSFREYYDSSKEKVAEVRAIIYAVGMILGLTSIFFLFYEVGLQGARDIKDNDHRVRRMLKLLTMNASDTAMPLINDYLTGHHIQEAQILDAVEGMAREEECADECVILVKNEKIIMANAAAHAIFCYPPRGMEGLSLSSVLNLTGGELTRIPGIGMKARGIKGDRSTFLVYYQTHTTDLSEDESVITYIIRHSAVFGAKYAKVPAHNFVSIFDVLPLPYMVLDSELRIIAVNIPGERLLGMPRDKIVDRSLECVLAHPIRDPEELMIGNETTVIAKHGGDSLVFPITLRLVETGDVASGMSYYSTVLMTEEMKKGGALLATPQHDDSSLHENDLTTGDIHVVSHSNLVPSYMSIIETLCGQHPHDTILVCDSKGDILHIKDQAELLVNNPDDLNLIVNLDESFRLSDDRQLTRISQQAAAPLTGENLQRNTSGAFDLTTLSMFKTLLTEEPDVKISAVFSRPATIVGVSVRMWMRQVKLTRTDAVYFVFTEAAPHQVTVIHPRRPSVQSDSSSRYPSEGGGGGHSDGSIGQSSSTMLPGYVNSRHEAELAAVNEETAEHASTQRSNDLSETSMTELIRTQKDVSSKPNSRAPSRAPSAPVSRQASLLKLDSYAEIPSLDAEEAAQLLRASSKEEDTKARRKRRMKAQRSVQKILAQDQ
eukprot:TRINITY_DN2312_c0_g1_i2.p1 TRINITY_DN2312_c0_g1~~TRINITY_DN2312_c0_g1_i2.p1  ORF type:complete len:1875 (+),score=372.56 TRINITY_DN2312_c0_g1_i2:932-6556(+)